MGFYDLYAYMDPIKILTHKVLRQSGTFTTMIPIIFSAKMLGVLSEIYKIYIELMRFLYVPKVTI